jgi:hypothetical protein
VKVFFFFFLFLSIVERNSLLKKLFLSLWFFEVVFVLGCVRKCCKNE